ncbi:uncharacterized protein BJX67DRAFT_371001 [Aspergillus lucknowensis]|uniref:Integral membrane protein n=1 Tax=Aspergillus lucknowensis TaxID=176173 RepID=A0ABR4LXS8_9EURO
MLYQKLRLRRGLLSSSPLPAKPSTPTRNLFLAFLALYLVLVFVARYKCARDPTSAFFQPATGYAPAYSTVRAAQAEQYIADADAGVGEAWRWKSSPDPSICVGVATVARKNVRYFKGMVGSVLEGLSERERADMHLILFIAHTDPSQHPAYGESWVHRVADRVLLYDNESVDIEHIRSLETDEARLAAREKALFDYTYLLKACAAVNASYVAMLEDDVLAMDGWYHRTRQALDSAEEQMGTKEEDKWLYLRLFYTEQFLGWNSEEWLTYLVYSSLVAASIATLLLSARYLQPKLRPLLSDETLLLICGVFTPLLIGLYFASGRVTMLPIPPGVNEMPKFGCCSQGFVFPRSRTGDLIALYEEKRVGYVDMLTEAFANENGEIRWAVTPSVLQHVGRLSSKEALNRPGQGQSVAAALWNFAFELNDADVLRREHDMYRDFG